MWVKRSVCGAALGAVLLAASGAVAADFEWSRTDGRVELRRADETVWRFNFGADLAKPYFHPVAVPGVGVLTGEGPEDHFWHHALWFSWKTVNGVNYWEEERETRLSAGRTTVKKADIETRDDFSARIVLDIAYHEPEKAPILTEQRTIEISAPDASGAYRMDWTCAFTAQDDALLDRTPVPPEKWATGSGGYAGLSIRFADAFKDCRAIDSDGAITEQISRIRVPSRAVDYSGAIDGKPAGVAMLDHAENLNAPTIWYIINTGNEGMRFYNPAVIHNAPHQMKAGDTLTLRYRVLVHPGRLNAEALKAELNAWL
jgi:hypothetical protein